MEEGTKFQRKHTFLLFFILMISELMNALDDCYSVKYNGLRHIYLNS